MYVNYAKFFKCYVKPGEADIVQIPFKENQEEDASNSTKCIDINPQMTKVRSRFLLLPFILHFQLSETSLTDTIFH